MSNLRILRLALRLAGRDVRRGWRRTVTMMVLIALAVAAYVSVATVQRTFQPTREEQISRVMGGADLRAYPKSAPDWQPAALQAATDGLAARLPAGSRTLVDMSGSAAFSRAGRSTLGTLRLIDLTDPVTAPLYRVVAGSAARTGGDIALSTALARRLGVHVGDRITVGAGPAASIVGLLQDPWDTASLFGVGSPAGTLVPVFTSPGRRDQSYGWFVALGSRPVPGAVDQSGDALSADYAVTRRADVAEQSGSGDARLLFAGEAFLLAEIGLLIAAGFVVLARHRRRDLAMIGVAGGTVADRRRIVVCWGAVVGATGAVAGVLLGLGAVLAAYGILQQRFQRAPVEFRVDTVAAAGALALAVVVSSLAAGWAARRVLIAPILDGLRDRDVPAPRSDRRATILSVVVLSVTVVLLVVGAVGRQPLPAAAGMLGLLAAGGVLLSRRLSVVQRLSPRSVSLRLAARDIGRNGRRSAGLLVAVASVVALAVTVVGVLGGIAAHDAGLYRPAIPDDAVLVVGAPVTGAKVPEISRAVGAGTAAPFTTAVAAVSNGEVQLAVDNPQVRCVSASGTTDADPCARKTGFHVLTPQLGIAELPAITTILGRPLTGPELRAYQDGQALALNRQVVGPDGTLAVGPPGSGATARAHSQLRRTVPAIVVATGREYQQLPIAFLSPAAARKVGLTSSTAISYYLPVRSSPSGADEDRARSLLLAADPDGQLVVERGDPSVTAMRQLTRGAFGLSLASIAVIIAVAMALAGAEMRGDLAVLSTVGASRAARRRISSWEGAAMALVGALLGAFIGVLGTFTLTRAVDVGTTGDGWWLATVTVVVATLLGAITGRLSAQRTVQLRTRFE